MERRCVRVGKRVRESGSGRALALGGAGGVTGGSEHILEARNLELLVGGKQHGLLRLERPRLVCRLQLLCEVLRRRLAFVLNLCGHDGPVIQR